MVQPIYFDNYMPAADIAVFGVCMVITVLLATSYTVKTKTYALFLNMLAYLFIASQSDARSDEIVGRLAGMFADLHYSVLYEGIDDESDEKRCIGMSASYLQGYRYSKPVPMDDLRNFFSKVS